MGIVDYLSVMSVSCSDEERRKAESVEVATGLFQIEAGGPTLTSSHLARATHRDPVLSKVLTYTRSGWPATTGPELIPFRHRSDELSTEGDCVLWGHRVFVPARYRRQVLTELHEGHLGCAKMKQLARRNVW